MVKTWALFPKTADSTFAIDYFLNQHVALVERLLKPEGLFTLLVEEGLAIEAPGLPLSYVALSALAFPSLEALEEAMRKHGAEISAAMKNFTNIKPLIQVTKTLR